VISEGRDGITVIDRTTGLTLIEHIPKYIKVAMKLMYGSFASHATQSFLIIRLLHHMSAKQGKAMDDPRSKKKIPEFVHTYLLDTDELLRPVTEFGTFNEFFFRELKLGARVVAEPDNNAVAVSPADARSVVFGSLSEATRIWIKGSEFSIGKLLGPQFADIAEQFVDGSLLISRLAPQDYHRFHIAVTGRIARRAEIDGALYTVNPTAINRHINVFVENKRVVNEVHTADFGTVMVIAVGATIVGSINFTVPVGGEVRKGQELGYFAFGGSTCLTLFQKDKIKFDEDLLRNTSLGLETLLKVGMRIGEAVKP